MATFLQQLEFWRIHFTEKDWLYYRPTKWKWWDQALHHRLFLTATSNLERRQRRFRKKHNGHTKIKKMRSGKNASKS